MKELKDRVALITGGSRGIGKSIVTALAEAGAHVAFTYRSSQAKADEIVASLSDSDGNIKAYQSDAASYEACEQLVKDVISDYGQIDILVNNAGITQDNLILRMTSEQWDRVLETNLKSVFNMTKQIARPMMKNRKGSIINISSIVGVIGNAGQSNYAASKAGIIGFSKSIAKELASRNIRCNVVAPGYIETEMTAQLPEEVTKKFMENIPLKRMGTGEDIANAVIFLASDKSAYINGQVLSVCGGLNV